MTRRPLAVTVAAAAASVVLAGCGGSGSGRTTPGGTQSPSTSPTTSPTTTPTSLPAATSTPRPAYSVPVRPGIHLTDQGTRLALGRAATVAWKVDAQRTGVLRLRVTRLERATTKAFRDFRLDASARRSTPYYVHVRVTNLGRSDLAGVRFPLLVRDRTGTLNAASSFKGAFKPCPSRALPKPFGRGKATTVCLVYFVPRHGRLVSVDFRPAASYDAISWHGRITPAKPTH